MCQHTWAASRDLAIVLTPSCRPELDQSRLDHLALLPVLLCRVSACSVVKLLLCSGDLPRLSEAKTTVIDHFLLEGSTFGQEMGAVSLGKWGSLIRRHEDIK